MQSVVRILASHGQSGTRDSSSPTSYSMRPYSMRVRPRYLSVVSFPLLGFRSFLHSWSATTKETRYPDIAGRNACSTYPPCEHGQFLHLRLHGPLLPMADSPILVAVPETCISPPYDTSVKKLKDVAACSVNTVQHSRRTLISDHPPDVPLASTKACALLSRRGIPSDSALSPPALGFYRKSRNRPEHAMPRRTVSTRLSHVTAYQALQSAQCSNSHC